MDKGTLHGIATILVMVAFLGVVIWAYSSKRKKRFDEAAHLPLADESKERSDLEREREAESEAANSDNDRDEQQGRNQS